MSERIDEIEKLTTGIAAMAICTWRSDDWTDEDERENAENDAGIALRAVGWRQALEVFEAASLGHERLTEIPATWPYECTCQTPNCRVLAALEAFLLAAGLGMSIAPHAPEPTEMVIRSLCGSAAPLVANGGGFVGCELDAHHGETDHRVTIMWSR